MLQGVEAESCQRAELLLLALDQLQRCWDQDRIHPTTTTPSTGDPPARSLALSHQLAERCYFGPTHQERHCWDTQLRPLFNVVIATLLLQQEPPDLTPTRSLLATLVRLCQEVFGDLQLATTLQHLLDSNSPSIDATALRLQLRSGDALGVAITLLHQRRAGFEPSLKPFDQALANVRAPIHAFMMSQTREDDLAMFLEIARQEVTGGPETVPFATLVPAFLTSELKSAFTIGFLIYIPFVVLDLVVASVLMSMGMMMISPMMISMPFKLMLFVLVDGWSLIMGSMAASFVNP
jgi:hypothetical protein